MDSCVYESIKTKEGDGVHHETFSWTPFLRQLMVSSGVWTCFFMTGLGLGAPTVIVPQLRREANSADAVTDEMASWISSINMFGGIPWVVILSAMTSLFGRKIPFLFVNIAALISFVLLYCATSITHVLICQALSGIILGGQITVALISITEYTAPKYRGLFLTIKTATSFWGVWTSNAIGTFFHWRNIGIFGILCAVYGIVTVSFWPESPFWLASKGKFDKCATAHRWLKGSGPKSENELGALIDSSKKYLDRVKKSKTNSRRVATFCETISSKSYYKPISLSFTAMCLQVFCGKFVCAVYAIDIIKRITEVESTAYTGMLILDGVTVFGMYLGCLLSKIYNRRLILISFTSVGIVFLYIISVYLFLIQIFVVVENNYLSLIFLIVFSLSMSCGPMILITSIFAEITPLVLRNFSHFLYGIIYYILLGTVLKTSPLVFRNFKMFGTFLFYGIVSTVCLYILYKYLPETKDKTLQEIQDSMVERKNDGHRELSLENFPEQLQLTGNKREQV